GPPAGTAPPLARRSRRHAGRIPEAPPVMTATARSSLSPWLTLRSWRKSGALAHEREQLQGRVERPRPADEPVHADAERVRLRQEELLVEAVLSEPAAD